MSTLTGNATHLSDVNELMVGYFVNGKKWFDKDAEAHYIEKRKKVNVADHDAQMGRAEVMAEKFMSWAKAKGYSQVKEVFWTARPGSLQAAVGPDIEVNPKENPTDILVRFSRGPGRKFLGISAKATAGHSDIGFKNPGIGTLEKNLGIDLNSILSEKLEEAIKKFGLSENQAKRKLEIRANKKIQKQTQKIGSEALSEVIDEMLKKYKKMKPDDLQKHILTVWMDAGEVFPPYVKVTGMGAKVPYSAKVEDPLKNDKLAAINSNKIQLSKAGNETILVAAGNKHIMKMRAKFESEKLASSFKFSADPWS